MIRKILASYDCAVSLLLNWIAPIVLLLMRIVPALAFFKSGTNKNS